MVTNALEEFKVGDLVRIARAQHCLGLVVETSDKWTRNVHHAKVFWLTGDYVTGDPPSAVWMPVRELEIVSKVDNKKLDNY